MIDRRLGLEQEFFVVDEAGESANRADELIAACQKKAGEVGLSEECYAPEWVKNILEIATRPATSPENLAQEYVRVLSIGAEEARKLGLRLYPLSAYPLHLIPTIRDMVNNHVQVRTVGHERFLHAGKCTGTHLHLEVQKGTIDPTVGISYASTKDARDEVLNTYNMGTALDPVLIALGRACPFYEGDSTGLAYHTTRYRGSQVFGWEGVYTMHPQIGSLRPYASSIEELVHLQFERHFAWLTAMDLAQVDRSMFYEGGGLLKSSWNPVRLNQHGTVELRNIDSNLPNVVLGLVLLVYDLHHRLLEEKLKVVPRQGQTTIEVEGDEMIVPDFEYLNNKLLFAAVTAGITDEAVNEYAESVLALARPDQHHQQWLSDLVPQPSTYETTESRLLAKYYPSGEKLSRADGLTLVRDVCDEFDKQIRSLAAHISDAPEQE